MRRISSGLRFPFIIVMRENHQKQHRLERALSSEADITASLQVIRGDKTADPTAREFAMHYSDRAQADTSRKKADVGIIKDYCSR